MRIKSQRIFRPALVITVLSSLLLSTSVFSSPWKDSDFISDSVTQAQLSQSAKSEGEESQSLEALKYRSLELDEFAWKTLLQKNTSSKLADDQQDNSTAGLSLVLPLPDGTEAEVVATETSVLAPELSAKFPELKTWKISGVTQKISGRIDSTSLGFHAMLVMPNGDSVFIEPDENKDADRVISSSAKYISFSKLENNDHFQTEFKCGVDHNSVVKSFSEGNVLQSSAKEVLARPAFNLITYRLAVATTGEYTQYHGGTKASALSAVITTINRVNEIYERDSSITFQLVPEQLDLMYTDSSNDPYSNTDINALLEQNISNLNDIDVLGSANYDIGHVFGSGNVGGLAFVGSTCNATFKAGGATGATNPIGDAFALDYVAHEIGHQMGAQHTFNSECGERGVGTAVEPGSGSTIMSYAGLCGANNIQNEVDAQFHVVSIEEIIDFSRNGDGNSCGSSTVVTNENPIISAGEDFTVPARTPIVLIADGFDSDGDELSYSWEQADSGTATDVDVDSGDNALFRSRALTTSHLRFIPRLSDIYNNEAAVGEHLPVTNRDMDLRITVRDGNGGVQYDAVTMTVHDTGSTFEVTSHTSSRTYGQTDQTTVSWDVAGTNSTPISCASVDIGLITLDGTGIDITTTDNDGSELITIPSDAPGLSNARFIVSCATSQFFSLSKADLTILASLGTGEDDTSSLNNDTSSSSGGGGSFGYMTLLLLPLLIRRFLRRKYIGNACLNSKLAVK